MMRFVETIKVLLLLAALLVASAVSAQAATHGHDGLSWSQDDLFDNETLQGFGGDSDVLAHTSPLERPSAAPALPAAPPATGFPSFRSFAHDVLRL
jgi:hypothetical protein